MDCESLIADFKGLKRLIKIIVRVRAGATGIQGEAKKFACAKEDIARRRKE